MLHRSTRIVGSRAFGGGLLLSAMVLGPVPTGVAHAEPPVLFDGKTLAGWDGDPSLWRVEDGELVGLVEKTLEHNAFLVSDHKLRDFRLVVDVQLKTTSGQNSGIQFRSEKLPNRKNDNVKGYQADVGGPDGEFWCDVYDERGRGWMHQDGPPERPLEGWNTYEIVAVGHKLMAALNGSKCFEIDDPKGPAEGIIALQLHSGGDIEVRYRNFMLTENPKPTLLTVDSEKGRIRMEDAPALSPRDAVSRMEVPEGFRVDVIAAEPRVRQPVAFTFDERGRIWVAEALSYPQRSPEGQGKDRLIILEDRDGNGTFESRKFFADNLNLVSGFEVGFGGVFVGAAPYMLFIPDRNGDDKPDGPPEVLLDGFSCADTHETPNAFVWGPDGWLYGNHGVFNDSLVGKPGTPDDQRIKVTAAVWRYHPTRHVFEIFAHGGSNQWGLDFNEEGEAFITTCRSANGGGPVTHMIQGGYFWRQAGSHDYQHVYEPIKAAADHDHGWGGAGGSDLVYGGHSHVGTMIYQGDNWPAQYRGQLFTHNLHGGRINQERILPRGSGYVVKHAERDFLFAKDPWFVGVALRSGPDGAVYMIDWYDQQHCHHRDIEKWDRSNGRVYRVSYGKPKRTTDNLTRRDDLALVELQTHENDWHVRTARRLLQERAAKGTLSSTARQRLRGMLETATDHRHRLRALWALASVGEFDLSLGQKLLGDPEASLRAWAVQLLTERGDKLPAVTLRTLATMAKKDPSAVVRLHLASSLQRMDLADRWSIARALLGHGEDGADRNLPAMIWFGFEPLMKMDLERAMRMAETSAIEKVRYFAFRRASMEDKGLEAVVSLLGRTRKDKERHAILEAMTLALEGRTAVKAPRDWARTAVGLYRSADPALRQPAEILAARFGDGRVLPELRRLLADSKAGEKQRKHALAVLGIARDPDMVPVLHGLLDDLAFRTRAIKELARFDHALTPAQLLKHYATMSTEDQSAALNTLVAREAYALELLRAIQQERLPRKDLTAYFARQVARYENADIRALLAEMWGSTREQSQDKKETIAAYRAYWNHTESWIYSAARGRLVFENLCAQCHKLFGEGGELGPDLTGSNRHDIDYLLENIIDPSALIGKDFQLTMVETTDGQLLSGMLQQENARTLTLATLNEKLVVEKKNIKDTAPSDSSMMPEGLLLGLDKIDVQNLLKYLGQSGQVERPPALDDGAKPAAGKSVGVHTPVGGVPGGEGGVPAGGRLHGNRSGAHASARSGG